MDEMEFQQNPLLAQAESLLQDADRYTKKDYRSVCQAITQFENHCKDHDYDHTEVDDACFFLCAFLDEQCSWEKSLLSTFYESDANKDNEFFERLKQRQNDSHKNIDLLELAYLCLSLGFRGKFYKAPPDNGVIAVMDSLYSDIRNVRHETSHRLAVGHIEKEEKHWRCPPIWITILIALVILVSIFIPYNKKLNQYMTPALDTLQNVIQTDNAHNEN